MKKPSILNVFMISMCMSLAYISLAYCDSSGLYEGTEILFNSFIGEDESNIYIDSKEIFWNPDAYGERHSNENPVFVLPKSNISGIYKEDAGSFYKRNVYEYGGPDSGTYFKSADCNVMGSNLYVDGVLVDYVENYHDSSNPDMVTHIYARKAPLPNSKELIIVNREDLPPGVVPPHSYYDRTLYVKDSYGIKKVNIDSWFSMQSATVCSNGSVILFGKTNHPVFYFNTAYIMDQDMNMTSAADFISQKLGVGIVQNSSTKNIFVIGMSGESVVMLVAPNPEKSLLDQLSHSNSYGFYNLNGDLSMEKRVESYDVFSKLQHELDSIDSDEIQVSDSKHIYVISDSFDTVANLSSGESFEIHKFGEEIGRFKAAGSAKVSFEGVFKDKMIPVYKYKTGTCICAEDLVIYGFEMKWDPDKRRTDFNTTGTLRSGKHRNLRDGPVYKSDVGIYVNGKYTESFNTGGYSLVDIYSLEYLTDYKMDFSLEN
ncbi:hypothetical protein SAMN02745945_00082 [Peptoclostridium litorale DSM 5388]|uniref:Uncharacterized protein n=1 Tax=Peptoclostridium litorale DSM 5388 TaxID=1121324 RepID=A0A069RR74_PEPLI|nr:hypothetical protein [Peptoclostridium litorale]KDR96667.1 hypothetical protein CLIT_2c02730 [Peptoclostridium litorale DSM 5388]SIN67915.1 hypothetical protein SAMN02745945_00082 [Peptoclostridium litorale DSM 5388]